MYTRPLARLIDQLQRLPGIGPKTAQRLAFYLLKRPKTETLQLAQALIDAMEQIGICSQCFNLSADDPCETCANPNRDGGLVCVVAEPRDIVALERTREYRGRYHVLGGVLSPMEGIGPDQLKVKELVQRVNRDDVTEVIMAINPTVEGETTILYVGKLLKPFTRVTRLASGLPLGGDLEYADEMTLARALEDRREF